MADDATTPDLRALGSAARSAQQVLALAPTDQKNRALGAMAARLRQASEPILAANAGDVARAAAANRSEALVDRLKLDPSRLEAMARSLEEIAALPDPVGETTARWTRPNGLEISRVRVPIGVIGIIFESRPNVTADAGALCMKSGNAAILRGGSDSFETARAILAPAPGGPRTSGAAAGRDPDVADRIARRRRRAPGRPRGHDRSARAARRQEPGCPGPKGCARSGAQPSGGRVSCLCARQGGAGQGARHLSQLQDAPHRRLWRGRDDPDRRGSAAGICCAGSSSS